jgi:hypothetical protein
MGGGNIVFWQRMRLDPKPSFLKEKGLIYSLKLIKEKTLNNQKKPKASTPKEKHTIISKALTKREGRNRPPPRPTETSRHFGNHKIPKCHHTPPCHRPHKKEHHPQDNTKA